MAPSTTLPSTSDRSSSDTDHAGSPVTNGSTEAAPRPGISRMDGNYGRLSVTGMNWNIPTNQGAHEHALKSNGEDSWRFKTVKFIHSSKVQIALMVMLFVDVIILFIELLFLAQYPHCTIVERDAISCCPSASSSLGTRRVLDGSFDTWDRVLAETASSAHGSEEEEITCAAKGLEPSFNNEATCNPEKWHAVHTVEDVLFAFTVFILSVFMLELTISMIALTPQVFFRQFFFLLDFVIIAISLALEVTFHIIGEDAIYEYVAGILVVSRIWRFIRIGHGIVEITSEMAHRQYEDLLGYAEDLQDRLKSNDIPFPPMDERLKKQAESEDEDNLIIEMERKRRAEKFRKESGGDGDHDHHDQAND